MLYGPNAAGKSNLIKALAADANCTANQTTMTPMLFSGNWLISLDRATMARDTESLFLVVKSTVLKT